MSDGRHGKDEATSIVAWLQAKIERVTADRDLLAEHLAERERLDQVTFAAADLPAAAGDQTGPLPVVPGQRPRSRHAAARGTHLRLVKVIIPAGLAALGGAARHLLSATPAAKAAVAVALTAGVVTAGAVAVVGPHAAMQAIGATPAASAPASGLYSATPIPVPSSSLRLIGSVTRPGLDARSSRGLPPVTILPWYDSSPSSSPGPSPQSPPAASPSPSASGVPATLQISGTDPSGNINLSGGGTVTLTLSVSGTSGWVSWRIDVDTPGATDLDFSKKRGVLQVGQTDQVVVSLDAAQDGAGQEVFSVGGQQIAATLPAPAPTPSPADVAPTAGATDMPSPAAS